jgi:hypothetical protein
MRFAVLIPLASLAACSTPQEIRTLAARTSPFLVVTRASVPDVDRAFALQSTRTSDELVRFAGRRKGAERKLESTVLLWSLDKGETDKRSLALLDRLRSNDAAVLAAAIAPDPQVAVEAPAPP